MQRRQSRPREYAAFYRGLKVRCNTRNHKYRGGRREGGISLDFGWIATEPQGPSTNRHYHEDRELQTEASSTQHKSRHIRGYLEKLWRIYAKRGHNSKVYYANILYQYINRDI